MSTGMWLPAWVHTHAHAHTYTLHSASHSLTQLSLPQDPFPPVSLIQEELSK